jgi:hypothetical protein
MTNTPTNSKNKQIVLPIGFNALVNDANKTALMIGEYKTPATANTALTLINKPSAAELLAAIPAGYSPVYPPKPSAPAPKA